MASTRYGIGQPNKPDEASLQQVPRNSRKKRRNRGGKRKSQRVPDDPHPATPSK